MRIYYTTVNHGDGSYGVQFFERQECIDILEDYDPETYGCGEGGGSFDADNFSDAVLGMAFVKEYIEDE